MVCAAQIASHCAIPPGQGRTAKRRALPQWPRLGSPGVKGAVGDWGTWWGGGARGSVAASKFSPGPARRPREGSERSEVPGLPHSLQSREQTWEPGHGPEETEGRKPKRRPGTPSAKAESEWSERLTAGGQSSERKRKPWSRGPRRNPEAGKPIENY